MTAPNTTERFAYRLHNEVMLACRSQNVGWDRADEIAKEAVRSVVFGNYPPDTFDEYWEDLILRNLGAALEAIDAEIDVRSLR